MRVEAADEARGSAAGGVRARQPSPGRLRAASHELSLPPKLTYGQIKGFTLYATRTILSGEGEELIELAKPDLHELETKLPGPCCGPLITITG